MTTALEIINDSLAELGVIGPGKAAVDEDVVLGLRKLNQLLQRLANSPLMVPARADLDVPTTGVQTYMIGPTGAVVTARPLKLIEAWAIDSGGLQYELETFTKPQWHSIAVKAVSSPPSGVWLEGTSPNATLHVYGTSSGYTIRLDCLRPLTAFASIASTVTLPEGYETMLTLMLADDLASAYGVVTSPGTLRRLAAVLAQIRRTNAEPLHMSIEASGEDYEIERGW